MINDFNPDLIHVYGTENSFGEIIPHTHVPVVIDLQGILSLIVNKWFSGISKLEVIAYSSLFSILNMKSHYHDYKLKVRRSEREKRMLRHAGFVMGRTQWDQMISRIMAPGAVYLRCERVIKEAFWKVDWKMPGGPAITILSVMNEDFYKGLDVIYQSCRLLKQAGMSFTWKIAGLRQQADYVKIISRKFKQNASDLHIEFLGKTDSTVLAKLLSQVHFLVNPSYMENSPNSVCEAMVAGTPVIASNVGGVPSLVDHDVSGWTFQEGDFTMLSGLILSLSGSPETLTKVGSEGKRIARKRHDPSAIATKIVGNYNLMLGKSIQQN